MIDHLPILNENLEIETPLADETGQEFMARTIREAAEPVTFLEIGPLTSFAEALAIDPGIEENVKHVLWMGGALNVFGNVAPVMEAGHDGTAEWNVYWDPYAAARVWETDIPITICPLDITNNVPVKSDFIKALGRRRRQSPIADLVGQCYALVMTGLDEGYFFWDVLTTAYLDRPDLFTIKEWETTIITDGPSAGRTKVTPGGRLISALDTVDTEAFYEYIMEEWSRPLG